MTDTAFSYKSGSSFMHRCPAWIKLLLIPVVSIVVFKFPVYFAIGLCMILIVLSFVLKFSVREQLRDLKAVLYYATFLIFAKLIGSVTSGQFDLSAFIRNEKETWLLLLKLLCVMQSVSILFKTSTSLQIREGLEVMELAVRRCLHLKSLVEGRPNAPIAQAVSLFICFIPQVSKNWQQAERAWKARGGRKSLRMFVVLLPVFFSVGMKQAYNTARAISIRQKTSG